MGKRGLSMMTDYAKEEIERLKKIGPKNNVDKEKNNEDIKEVSSTPLSNNNLDNNDTSIDKKSEVITSNTKTEKKSTKTKKEKNIKKNSASVIANEPKEQKEEKTQKEKHAGGRPTNKAKGLESRKQYTLTLKENTYKLIMDEARKEEMSFAKFMERAALQYIKRQSNSDKTD